MSWTSARPTCRSWSKRSTVTRRRATSLSRRRSGSSRSRSRCAHDGRARCGREEPHMSIEVRENVQPQGEQKRVPLVKLVGVKKYFPVTQGIIFQKKIGFVHAVDGIDL